MIELVDHEATTAEVEVAATAVAGAEGSAPEPGKLTIFWDSTKGVTGLGFDNKTFQTWPLLIAAIDLAKQHAMDRWQESRAIAAQMAEQQAQEAARLQAKLAHQQNQAQQRRR